MNRIACRRTSAGMTIWTMMVVMAVGAFFVLLGMRSVPVYLNHMKVNNAVERVATDSEMANANAGQLRAALQRYWDIEMIRHLDARDVIVHGAPGGQRSFQYDYEARVPFIANIDLLFYFDGDIPIDGGR